MYFSSFAPYGITGLPSPPAGRGGKGALQNFSEKRTLGFNTGIYNIYNSPGDGVSARVTSARVHIHVYGPIEFMNSIMKCSKAFEPVYAYEL